MPLEIPVEGDGEDDGQAEAAVAAARSLQHRRGFGAALGHDSGTKKIFSFDPLERIIPGANTNTLKVKTLLSKGAPAGGVQLRVAPAVQAGAGA